MNAINETAAATAARTLPLQDKDRDSPSSAQAPKADNAFLMLTKDVDHPHLPTPFSTENRTLLPLGSEGLREPQTCRCHPPSTLPSPELPENTWFQRPLGFRWPLPSSLIFRLDAPSYITLWSGAPLQCTQCVSCRTLGVKALLKWRQHHPPWWWFGTWSPPEALRSWRERRPWC